MFEVGWSELLVIAVVAILVVGPRELPGMLRTFGKYAGQMRRMAGDFQRQFNDALKEAELDEVRRGIESVRSANPVSKLGRELNPLKEAGDSMRRAIEDPGAPKPATKPAAEGTATTPSAEWAKKGPTGEVAENAAEAPLTELAPGAPPADVAASAAEARKSDAAE